MGVYITEQIKLQILITFFLFEQKKGYFSKKKFFRKKILESKSSCNFCEILNPKF